MEAIVNGSRVELGSDVTLESRIRADLRIACETIRSDLKEEPYVVVDLEARGHGGATLFWSPRCHGYTADLLRAGIFPESHVLADPAYLHNRTQTLAVPLREAIKQHPAYSDAFHHFGLPIPEAGPWQRGLCGGWSCRVEQWHYGHRAKKATWLYSYGVENLPSLKWTRTPDTAATAYVMDMGSRERDATPPQFRDVLLSIARSARDPR